MKKKHLTKIRIAFAMLLVVQILVMLALNLSAIHVVTKQVDQQNNRLLNSYSVAMSKQFEQVRQLQSAMLTNSFHTNYLYTQNDPNAFLRYELTQFLTDLYALNTNNNDTIYDMFIYYEEEDRIVSGVHNSLSADEYIALHYGNEDFDLKNQFSTSGSEPTYFTVTCGKEHLLASNLPYISFPSRSNKSSAVIVLKSTGVVNTTELKNSYNDSHVAIFNAQQELLIASHEKMTLSDYTGDPVYTGTLDGDSYTYYVYRDTTFGGYYALAVPTAIYWEGLSPLNLITFIGCAIFAVLSFALMAWLSRYVYSPVKNLVSHTKAFSQSTDSIQNEALGNEFEYVLSTLHDINRTKNSLLNKIESNEVEVTYAYLTKIVSGMVKDDTSFDENFALCGSTEPFVVLIFTPESYQTSNFNFENSERAFKISSLIYKNILEELALEYGHGYFLPRTRTEFVLVASIKESLMTKSELCMVSLCTTFEQIISEKFNMHSTVAIGSTQQGVSAIHQSYLDAKTALNYKFIYGKGSITSWYSIKDHQGKIKIDPSLCQKLVLTYLSTAYEQESLALDALIDTLTISMHEDSVTFTSIAEYRYALCNVLDVVSSNLQVIQNTNDKTQTLSNAETLDEFKLRLTERLQQSKAAYLKGKEKHSILNKALLYIEQNYMNVDLSIQTLAADIGYSETHLTRIFKAELHCSPHNYINTTRVEHTKQYLTQTNFSLQEIAERVGFLSANTLVRVFKKHEGMPPRAYADMHKDKTKPTP